MNRSPHSLAAVVRVAAAALVLATFPCAAARATVAPPSAPLRIEPLASGVAVRLRGLSAASDTVAWASGRDGTVLHTVDGGRSWLVSRVQGAEALDFRDVQAFGADEAIVMGAGPGDASRVYRTTDGGRHWVLVLRNEDADGFFDCLDFVGRDGRLLGDPVGGRFQVYASHDRGASWTAVPGPRAEPGEAAFAASGTCLKRLRGASLVVTGGMRARVHLLPDVLAPGSAARAIDAPGLAPLASAGLFSVAQRHDGFVAVGGDYKQEAVPAPAFGFRASPDGVSFARMDAGFAAQPSGYRSGIACAARRGADACIATGPGGTDMLASRAGLATWTRVADTGYDSVATAGRVFWFSGDGGRLGRLVLPPDR